MKRVIRLVIPVAALLAAFFATNGVVLANKDMAKKEKKPCTTCHEVKGMPKAGTADACKLTAVGKDYQKKNVKAADQKCK